MVFFLLRCFDSWSPPERKEIRKEGTEEGRKASRMIGRKKEGRKEGKKEGRHLSVESSKKPCASKNYPLLVFFDCIIYPREMGPQKAEMWSPSLLGWVAPDNFHLNLYEFVPRTEAPNDIQ